MHDRGLVFPVMPEGLNWQVKFTLVDSTARFLRHIALVRGQFA
jgi:hypothetical protein